MTHGQHTSPLKRFKQGSKGLIDFAMLIEQSDPKRREMFIAQAREDDPDFLDAVMKKVVYFDELFYMEDGVLAEILSQTPATVLAYALRGQREDFRKKMISQMGTREIQALRNEEEKMEKEVPHGMIDGAQKHILKTARKMEAEGKIVFELTDCPRFRSHA